MVVTGGVAAILNIIIVILGLLGNTACQEALALLGDDIGDVATLGLEVVLHYLGLILTAIVLEDGVALKLAHAIGHTDSLHLAAVHVHADLGSAHVNVPIQDFAVAVHHGMVAPEQDNAILGIELDHVVQVHPVANKAARVGRRHAGADAVTF